MKWEKTNLKDCTLKIGSGVTPTGGANVYQDKGIALFRSQNIYNGSFVDKGLAFINEVIAEKMKSVAVFEGDILLNITGDSVARCCSAPVEYLPGRVNQHVAIIRPDTLKMYPKFLMYQLISPFMQSTLLSYAEGAGATRNALTKGILEDIKIQIPPLPTQQRIASILSAYDDLIENNLKRIKLLEEKAFLRYKGIVKSEKFKLEELYDTSSGGTPSRTNSEYFTGDINWFKSKELFDSILLESEEKITEVAVDKSSAKIFPEGAVIMAMYGATIGKLGLLSQPSTTNQACCAIIQRDEFKSNYYILNWLFENREYVLSFRMGAAQENISQQVIKNLLVSIPNDRDLKIFNSEMKPIYQQIKNLHQQNTKLREARDILLPRLMSGEIEV